MGTDDHDDNEDERLWHHVTQSVRPLIHDRTLFPDKDKPQKKPARSHKAARPTSHPVPAIPAEKWAALEQWQGESGVQTGETLPPLMGLDRATAERLRRGKLPIEGTLDLHGLTQDEAHGALIHFITTAQERGKRCVLVITGKGRSPQSEGVLKRRVPQWLAMPPLRDIIIRAQPAQPRHGGSGALYVLLRRNKRQP